MSPTFELHGIVYTRRTDLCADFCWEYVYPDGTRFTITDQRQIALMEEFWAMYERCRETAGAK